MTGHLFVKAPQPALVLDEGQLVIVGGYYGYPTQIVSDFFGGVYVSGTHPCWEQLWQEEFCAQTFAFEGLPLPVREAWNEFRESAAANDDLRNTKMGVWKDVNGENLLLIACLPNNRYAMLASYGPEATLDMTEMARRLSRVYKDEPRSRPFRFEQKPRLPDGDGHLYLACVPLLGLFLTVGNRIKVERVFTLTYFDYVMLLIMFVIIPMRYIWLVRQRKRAVPPIRTALNTLLPMEAAT